MVRPPFLSLHSILLLALQKNADASKTKRKPTSSLRKNSSIDFLLAHLCEEASKILYATRSCFSHTSIDYTYQINVLFTQHQVELTELFLSYINFHKAFFHQGYELLAVNTEREFHSITTQVNSKVSWRVTVYPSVLLVG